MYIVFYSLGVINKNKYDINTARTSFNKTRRISVPTNTRTLTIHNQ